MTPDAVEADFDVGADLVRVRQRGRERGRGKQGDQKGLAANEKGFHELYVRHMVRFKGRR